LYQPKNDARKSSIQYTHKIDLELGQQRKEEYSIHLSLCNSFWIIEFGHSLGNTSVGGDGYGGEIEFKLGDNCWHDNRFGGAFRKYKIGSN
jgi:hypothetical protein